MAANNQTDTQVIELCQSAFHAEYYSKFDRAYQLHGRAIKSLNTLVNDAGLFDRDRKRVVRKQIKFHSACLQLIRPLKDGKQTELKVILPTSISAQKSLVGADDNKVTISMEEFILAKYQKDKEANPNTVPDAAQQHLLQRPVPFYTPMLDPELPVVTHHIYIGTDPAFTQTIVDYKVKSDTDDRQTLYVLQTRKATSVAVTGVTGSQYDAMLKGRPMHFYGSSLHVIQELPDRLNKRGWGPRRFTSGGRQFAWVTENDKETHPQALYEIERVWPKPGSKTGKNEHKVVGTKLAWGEHKIGLKKAGVLHMVGGMDQVFQEYILASQLTRLAIMYHGYDS